MRNEDPPVKKAWTPPQLIDYGTVEEITRQAKPKWWGSGDDLVSSIIS